MQFRSAPARPILRRLAFLAGFAGALAAGCVPALAQGISILRDTETEEMLKGYEQPLARAAGLDPNAVRVWLVGDPSVNAFVAEGQNMFILTGMMLFAKSPNEMVGVMAHETGHIKAGHLIRGQVGAQAAEVPMLLSMVLGVAAMIGGAGDAGMALIGLGAAVAQAQMAQFTRIQESTADQIALQLLEATHQSPMGLVHTFERFAAEEAMSAYRIDPYAVDHPSGQTRVADLQDRVETSPYLNVKDSPQAMHTFEMVQAKLAGFVLPPQEALDRYPVSDTSEPARYARAMVYLRQPQLAKALEEINSLIKDEPDNPYFYEVLGQIYLSMAKPGLAIPAYQKAVDLKPLAPQLRLGLAVAELATETPAMSQAALTNLKAATQVENDDMFTWYEMAQAYSNVKNEPMANLSTAEAYYAIGNMRQATVFAARARRDLPQGMPDWERANDILGAAAGQVQQQQ